MRKRFAKRMYKLEKCKHCNYVSNAVYYVTFNALDDKVVDKTTCLKVLLSYSAAHDYAVYAHINVSSVSDVIHDDRHITNSIAWDQRALTPNGRAFTAHCTLCINCYNFMPNESAKSNDEKISVRDVNALLQKYFNTPIHDVEYNLDHTIAKDKYVEMNFPKAVRSGDTSWSNVFITEADVKSVLSKIALDLTQLTTSQLMELKILL